MAMAYAAAWFCLFLTFLNVVSMGIGAIRARPRPAPLPPPRAAPGVSVIRPLCGLDNFCEETLESSFRLDYPTYEIIFCVALPGDPVLPLVQRLIAKYSDRASQVIVGDEKVSANP
ncbi:MAG TPA: ceramide glucosyltransferase, partial [Methylocella sp.]|nr:ceramide glucosyltransferase [Methylocella sp.]